MARKAKWDEETTWAIVTQLRALLKKRNDYRFQDLFKDVNELPDFLLDQVGYRYCPLYTKDAPDYADARERGYSFYDPDLLRAWMDEHLTDEGRKRALNAARQHKYKRGHALTTVTFNRYVFGLFKAWAEKHNMTLDDALKRLVETAANAEAADAEVEE